MSGKRAPLGRDVSRNALQAATVKTMPIRTLDVDSPPLGGPSRVKRLCAAGPPGQVLRRAFEKFLFLSGRWDTRP